MDPYIRRERDPAPPVSQAGEGVEPFNPWVITPIPAARVPRPKRGFWDWVALVGVGVLKGIFWLGRWLAIVLCYSAIVIFVVIAFLSILAIPIAIGATRAFLAPLRTRY